MPRRAVFAFAAALMLAGTSAQGQGGRPGGRGPERDGQDDPRRQGVEREFRQRFAQVVQRELGLDDAHLRRLQATLQKFEAPQRDLMRLENETRRDLRLQLRMGDSAEQNRVEKLLDDLLAVQKRRIELHEQEDRDLRGFLTPVQRARFYGLKEQLRRRVEEVQMKRRGPPGGSPPGGRMGPPPM